MILSDDLCVVQRGMVCPHHAACQSPLSCLQALLILPITASYSQAQPPMHVQLASLLVLQPIFRISIPCHVSLSPPRVSLALQLL